MGDLATIYFSGVIAVWVIAFLWENFSNMVSQNITVGDVLPVSFLSWICVIYMVWFMVTESYKNIKDIPIKISKKPKSKNQTNPNWHLEKVKEDFKDLM
jgi:hypothetical protein